MFEEYMQSHILTTPQLKRARMVALGEQQSQLEKFDKKERKRAEKAERKAEEAILKLLADKVRMHNVKERTNL